MFTICATDASYRNLMRPLTARVQAFTTREQDIQATGDGISMILGSSAQKGTNRYNGPCHFLMVS